jgi:TonB family protein
MCFVLAFGSARVGSALAADEADAQTAAAKQAKISQCVPDYPSTARRADATGVTQMRASIDEEGRVTGVQVTQASGATEEHGALDRAAMAFVKCMGPYKKSGSPYTTDSKYVWSLR